MSVTHGKFHVGKKEETVKELKTISLSVVASLKACSQKKDLDEGVRLHDNILKWGLLESNTYVGNALVSMYAKCGALAKACQVLEQLPFWDNVSWNAIIAGYTQQGMGVEALKCYEQMKGEAISPDPITYTCILKACGITREIDRGKQIHDEIVNEGLLGKDLLLGNALLEMYAKCGLLPRALQVLHQLPARDKVSWSALIAGYVQQGHCKEALHCFKRMQSEGLTLITGIYWHILKACSVTQELDMGKQIHVEIASKGFFGQNITLDTALVDMYAKCGALKQAAQVLDEIPVRDAASWNALIAGYVQSGEGKVALDCLERMRSEGVCPSAITYACILKACGITQEVDLGMHVHHEIDNHGLLGPNMLLANALVDMYAKCGVLVKARQVIDELFVRDIASWNSLLAGYVHHGRGKDALDCYEQVLIEGISPDEITYMGVLKACAITRDVHKGKQIHDELVSQGMSGKDVVLGNSLVDMYAKCGLLMKARQMLDELPMRNTVSWSALIVGYVQYEQGEEALSCYEQMQGEGLFPDAITYACILKACGITRRAEQGKRIHKDVASQGLLRKDSGISTALVDMYAKCGLFTKAQKVLEEIPVRAVATWNALLAEYVQQGQGKEALDCFQQMQREGHAPTAVTYVSILKACGITRDVDVGKQIHDEVVCEGLLGQNVVLGNALVNMYAKCGFLTKAREVLDELPVRNVVSWSALIAGYAQHGQGKAALGCFKQMQSEGLTPDTTSWTALIEGHAQWGQTKEATNCFKQMQHAGLSPNAITFVCMLNACTLSGLVDDGRSYFENMSSKYGITPRIEHHTCMVNLFSHAGRLDEAMAVIRKMPSSDYLPIWSTLLRACQKWGNAKLGRLAFDRIVRLDEGYAAAYVCMLELYAASGMYGEAEMIKGMGVRNDAWKLPGHSDGHMWT